MSLIVVINTKTGLATAIQTTLTNAGYTTLIARDASEAISLIETQSPTLILLGDTTHSFHEEIAILRAHSPTTYTAIVLQSDNYILANADYVERLGVAAVLDNPHSSAQLMQGISEWVKAV